MSTVNQNDLRVKNSKNLIDSFNTTDNALAYLFIGRPTAWPTGDNNPPVPTNNFKDFYQTYDQMLSLKKISDLDAYHMVPRVAWTSGVTYDIYRDDYGSLKTSSSTEKVKSFTNQTNLYDCRYYVINSSNFVYVCLFNNGGVPSTVEPQDVNDEPFNTSDGYQWLKLYSLSGTELLDYASEDFMPILTASTNNVTVGASGAVYTVLIDSPGDGYTTNPSNTGALPYYYCRINGDGDGAVARVTVNLTKVSKIEVIRYGTGYTEATLNFKANEVYASLPDLDANINSLNPVSDANLPKLQSTVILSPPGGWGSDLPRDLGGTRVGVFSTLLDSDFDFVEGVDFRQVGIIQDPTFPASTDTNPLTVSASYAFNYDDLAGTFAVNDTISSSTEINGVLATASGQIVNIDTTNKIVKYIQDPFLHRDTDDGKLYRFDYIQSQASATITITSSSGGSTNPTTLTGDLGGLTFLAGFAQPEINKYSGLMTYLANLSPITRTEGQRERISLLIGY
jgi:hypothetical protein